MIRHPCVHFVGACKLERGFQHGNVWLEAITPSYVEGGWHAEDMSEPAGGVVVGEIMRFTSTRGCYGC